MYVFCSSQCYISKMGSHGLCLCWCFVCVCVCVLLCVCVCVYYLATNKTVLPLLLYMCLISFVSRNVTLGLLLVLLPQTHRVLHALLTISLFPKDRKSTR